MRKIWFLVPLSFILLCPLCHAAVAQILSGSVLRKAEKVMILPQGHRLVSVENTLYRIDAQRRLIWKYTEGQIMFDFTFIKATDLVYGTAGDNTMFILQATTGKQLYRNSRNGSAAYGEVKAYGRDQCLITNNNWGYRERLNNPSIKDGVSAWRGTEALWEQEIPPEARLLVRGRRIFAVTKGKGGRRFYKEIIPPKTSAEKR